MKTGSGVIYGSLQLDKFPYYTSRFCSYEGSSDPDVFASNASNAILKFANSDTPVDFRLACPEWPSMFSVPEQRQSPFIFSVLMRSEWHTGLSANVRIHRASSAWEVFAYELDRMREEQQQGVTHVVGTIQHGNKALITWNLPLGRFIDDETKTQYRVFSAVYPEGFPYIAPLQGAC